ncbi:hypothetical protein V6N11_037748 [Hibiscus sabdariffa]|uniref:Uncharacterized protein n=2 Tax=Hibiscus sabdariffa TaxID=183260 RepID=A0ABR2B0K8_9ROSI
MTTPGQDVAKQVRHGKLPILASSGGKHSPGRKGVTGPSNGYVVIKEGVVSLGEGDKSIVMSHETRIRDDSHAVVTITKMGEGVQGSRKSNGKTLRLKRAQGLLVKKGLSVKKQGEFRLPPQKKC